MGSRITGLAAAVSMMAAGPAAAAPLPVGPETRANTTTDGQQSSPAVAKEANGDFVVVWEDFGGGHAAGIYGQRYDAGGAPVGGELSIDGSFVSSSPPNHARPSVAMDADGDFVVAWEAQGYDDDVGEPDSVGVLARRFDANGVGGPLIVVNDFDDGDQDSPDVAMEANGDFAVVWTSEGQDGDGNGVIGKRYDSSGNAFLPGEFPVNNFALGSQDEPAIAMATDGAFVVGWESFGQDGSGEGIFLQRFKSDGLPVGSEDPVNVFPTGNQTDPDVAMDADGDFVFAWTSDQNQDGSGSGIFGQSFDFGGAGGLEFRVNSETMNDQRRPAVARAPSGELAIAWDSFNQDALGTLGVYAQRFAPEAPPQAPASEGSEFRVNTTTAGDQRTPTMAMNAVDQFVVAWDSFGQDGDQNGIYFQRYAPPPGATTAAATSVTPSGATLNGLVEPNGDATAARFEYGTTVLYGTQTSVQGVGSSGQQGISASIGGLLPSTTYHYRVVATNGAGTTNGLDEEFTTPAAPAAPAAPAGGGDAGAGGSPPGDAPPASRPPEQPDSTGPVMSLTLKTSQRLRTVLARGLRHTASCSEGCTLRSQLLLDRRSARRLGLAQSRPVVVGTATKRLAAAGRTSLTVRLTRKARRQLRRVRRVRLTLRVVATDGAGNATTVSRRLTLKR